LLEAADTMSGVDAMPPPDPADVDALALLTDDHRHLQALFARYTAAGAEDHSARRAIAAVVCTALRRHATLEAEILYPAARTALGSESAALVATAELAHAVVDELVVALERLAPADPEHAATFAALAGRVERHIADEERELFPRIRAAPLDLRALAVRLRDRDEALVAETDSPGQVEPSADAEGEFEPDLDEAKVRRLSQ
jgi:hemerythrin-like domain-containing protein